MDNITKYKGISRDDILKIERVQFNDELFKQNRSVALQAFEEAASQESEVLKLVRERIKEEENRRKNDFEMCCICEMAILFLDAVEKGLISEDDLK